MNIGDAFPGNFLKAEDLKGKSVTVTISHLEMQKIADDEKPVLYFVGKEKGLVLNKTNANAIAELLGTTETDEWVGSRIKVFPTKTDYQGKRVDCLRVEESPPAGNERQAKQKPKAPLPEELTVNDIPFSLFLAVGAALVL